MGASTSIATMAEGDESIRKKNPHRFIVDDSLTDDNSTVTFHPDVMEEMDFFRGGHVKIRGKRQKMTVAVSLPDEEVEPAKVRVNKVMRKNLKVHLGDVVIIHNCEDCKYGKRIHVLPFEVHCAVCHSRVCISLRKSLTTHRHLCPTVVDALFLAVQRSVDLTLSDDQDSIEGVTGNLFDTYLKPYFMEAYRPVRKGGSTHPAHTSASLALW